MFKISEFGRHVVLLFLALRAADLVNLTGALWVVPKFVDRADLGAVLPVVTCATTIALPAFSVAFVFMREANRLSAQRSFGALKSMMRGVFCGTFLALLISLILALAILPRYLSTVRVSEAGVGTVVVISSFLGCFAPVYSDALNGLKRFGACGVIEIAAALGRLGTMLIVMPFRPVFGFFTGNAAQPLVRIAGALLALRSELRAPAEPYWTRPLVRKMAALCLGVLLVLSAPMLTSLAEQTIVRTALSTDLSAGYYLLTRLTDLLNYLTLPILLVLFPHAAEASRAGRSTAPLVFKSCAATAVGAMLLALVFVPFGSRLLALFPNAPADLALFRPRLSLPILLGVNVLTAFQTFYTNSEIAAGRFRFLLWFVPLHLAYAVLLKHLSNVHGDFTLTSVLILFLVFAAIRAAFVTASLFRPHLLRHETKHNW